MLPTGRNFYSVDPKAIPSRSAWEVGSALAELLVGGHAFVRLRMDCPGCVPFEDQPVQPPPHCIEPRMRDDLRFHEGDVAAQLPGRHHLGQVDLLEQDRRTVAAARTEKPGLRRGFALRLLDQLPKAPTPDRVDDEMDAVGIAPIVNFVPLE